MRNNKYYKQLFIVIALLSLQHSHIYAQKTPNVKLIPKNSILNCGSDSLEDEQTKLGIDYDGKVLFMGRETKNSQFGIAPFATYNFYDGFYVNAVLNYWSGWHKGISKTELGVGYENNISKNITFTAEYSRWILSDTNEYLKKAIENVCFIRVKWTNPIFTFEPEIDYYSGKEKIWQTDLNFYKKIRLVSFGNDKIIFIKPHFLTSFANPLYIMIYSNYDKILLTNNNFKPTDLELSLPIQLHLKNINIEPIFRYNIPLKESFETIKPFFYFTLHLEYNIK